MSTDQREGEETGTPRDHWSGGICGWGRGWSQCTSVIEPNICIYTCILHYDLRLVLNNIMSLLCRRKGGLKCTDVHVGIDLGSILVPAEVRMLHCSIVKQALV